MASLIDFLKNDDTMIAEKASKLKTLMEYKDSGKISESEYVELVDDLLDIEEVQKNIDDIERKEMIIAACKTLIQIAKMAGSL